MTNPKQIFKFEEKKGTFPAKFTIAEMENGNIQITARNRRASLSSVVEMPKADFIRLKAALADPVKLTKKTTGLKKPTGTGETIS